MGAQGSRVKKNGEDSETITGPLRKALPVVEKPFAPSVEVQEVAEVISFVQTIENTPPSKQDSEKPTAQVQPSVVHRPSPTASPRNSFQKLTSTDKVETNKSSSPSASSIDLQKTNPSSHSPQRSLVMNESTADSTGSITPDASTPKTKDRKLRSRQQTVVVQSQSTQDIKKAFEDAQQNKESLEELERKVLASVAQIEKENSAKYERLRKSASQELLKQKQAFEAARNVHLTHIKELQKVIQNLPSQLQTSNSMTFSTIASSEDAKILRRERDQLEAELQSVHETYRNMFTMYEQLKSMNKELREDNDHLRDVEFRMKEAVKKTNDKYMRMVEHAKERLNQANDCIAQLEKKCDDDTVTLRARLRQKELQLDAATKQLDIKKKECSELNEICQALIQKAECVSDSDN